MRYPCLVDKRYCNTLIHVVITAEGLDEDGAPITEFESDLLCNYQDTAKTVLTADKKLVQLSGVGLLPGDICPEVPVISSGVIEVYGEKRIIFQGTKARNPDGTVNYTELRII